MAEESLILETPQEPTEITFVTGDSVIVMTPDSFTYNGETVEGAQDVFDTMKNFLNIYTEAGENGNRINKTNS